RMQDIEDDPEKLVPVFRKRSCSQKRIGREDDSKKSHDALGGVDSKDSLLGANQIQGFFWGGGLGCYGSFGFERHGVGAHGSANYRSARPEGFDGPRQPDVR